MVILWLGRFWLTTAVIAYALFWTYLIFSGGPVLASSDPAAEIVIPKACIEKVEYKLDNNAECRGPDMEHMKCSGIHTLLHVKGPECQIVQLSSPPK